jgi:hypothetical protein
LVCFCVQGYIEDLEYTAKKEFEGDFKVENMPDEVDIPFNFYP